MRQRYLPPAKASHASSTSAGLSSTRSTSGPCLLTGLVPSQSSHSETEQWAPRPCGRLQRWQGPGLAHLHSRSEHEVLPVLGERLLRLPWLPLNWSSISFDWFWSVRACLARAHSHCLLDSCLLDSSVCFSRDLTPERQEQFCCRLAEDCPVSRVRRVVLGLTR